VRFEAWSHRTHLRRNDPIPDSGAKGPTSPESLMHRLTKIMSREATWEKGKLQTPKRTVSCRRNILLRKAEHALRESRPLPLHYRHAGIPQLSALNIQQSFCQPKPQRPETLLHISIVYTCQLLVGPLALPSSEAAPAPGTNLIHNHQFSGPASRRSASLPESAHITPPQHRKHLPFVVPESRPLKKARNAAALAQTSFPLAKNTSAKHVTHVKRVGRHVQDRPCTWIRDSLPRTSPFRRPDPPNTGIFASTFGSQFRKKTTAMELFVTRMSDRREYQNAVTPPHYHIAKTDMTDSMSGSA
jgi:hypothetical protein